ncbi:MAG TPA: UbiA family prenyltransferase [Kiritimatiellia bacterium]|nr:UbiA family prenyltransferase [Kiritimatiellia bacterium]HRZ11297.1 UbiA family prenyltransferase [Kiritimatiellia bacterium]HSA17152.1 UbiA family prenyltransferase [Kiritimatiellia bacterium]
MNSEARLFRAWMTFIRERFPPAANVVMAVFFSLGNAAVASRLAGIPFPVWRWNMAAVVTVLFFFRLRCFDEIKDYATDLVLTPTRPLARGLLTLRQVRIMFGVVTAAEFLLVAPLGFPALAAHAAAVVYSYLMYREFFVGAWLRPRLTLYAVAHTAVSILLGWSIAAQVLGPAHGKFPVSGLLFGIVNWMLFNVFEFGRKTFAPEEEKPGADSYSSLFGPSGAVALCMSQVGIALLALARGPGRVVPQLALAAVLLAAGLVYAARATPATARAYRTVSGVYLILFYLLVTVQAWPGGL